jgi:NAD(P)H-dependent FMN reductase
VTSKPRIGIVLSTTRPSRFADQPAQWLLDIAEQRGDADYEIVDLRDYPMPFFEEERSPAFVPPASEAALRWGRKMAELDGFIFITAEYNHSIPAVLKNALDYAYLEFNRKPATFVGYGGVGAARAIEQLRLILAEMQVASLKYTVHINFIEYMGVKLQGKTFADFPYLEDAVVPMLNDLVWWSNTLRAGRNEEAAANAPRMLERAGAK